MIPQPAMAPPPDAGKAVKEAPPDGEKKDGEVWRRELRIFRTEIQDLQRALGRVQSGEIKLADYAEYINKTMQDIQPALARLPEIEKVRGDDGDAIRHLLNTWEQVQNCPLLKAPTQTYQAEDQLRYLKALDVAFREIVFQVGFLTIPARLEDWLKKARVGYYIPFHEVFADEIPVSEDRTKLLKYFYWGSKEIKGGLIDTSSGVIYRYSPDLPIRIATAVAVGIVFLAAAYFVLTSVYLSDFTFLGRGPFYLYPTGLGVKDQSAVFTAWLAIIVGVVVHVAVATAKRAQTQGSLPPVIALGELFLWISAKFGNILLKLGLTLVAFYGYLFLAIVPNVGQALNVQLGEVFLIGYSLDSFIELFSTSIEQRTTAQVATLKKQLGVTET